MKSRMKTCVANFTSMQSHEITNCDIKRLFKWNMQF